MRRRLIAGSNQDFRKQKKEGGYWIVKKILLNELEVSMRSKKYYSSSISISELKVEGVVIRERGLQFKISYCGYL